MYTRKTVTESDVKRKAVKQVIRYLKPKTDGSFSGKGALMKWIKQVEILLEKEEFDITEYHAMKKELNSIIEKITDSDRRNNLRNSWFSFGRALDKKIDINK